MKFQFHQKQPAILVQPRRTAYPLKSPDMSNLGKRKWVLARALPSTCYNRRVVMTAPPGMMVFQSRARLIRWQYILALTPKTPKYRQVVILGGSRESEQGELQWLLRRGKSWIALVGPTSIRVKLTLQRGYSRVTGLAVGMYGGLFSAEFRCSPPRVLLVDPMLSK